MRLHRKFRVVPLADAVETIPTLARLFLEEWGPYYGPDGPGDATSDLKECCNRDELPIALVALDDGGTVLGTAALKSESLGAELGLGPWLAALLVPVEHRNSGLGTGLVGAIESEARRLGFESIFTSTDAATSIIKQRGWTELKKQVLSLRGPIHVWQCLLSPEMPIYLVEYDEGWPAQFTEERDRIVQTVSGQSVEVEHIGSTAIPGMAAKPIIDIMLLIADIEAAPFYIERLKTLEYQYYPYAEDVTPERRWFCKPNLAKRTHHLHLVERDSPFHRDHLLFRDYLRMHADNAHRYESLKRSLAERYPDDREAYTDAKSDFVANILEKARTESGRTF